jgi:glycosyltransferase involved in cell wall biosynthesis
LHRAAYADLHPSKIPLTSLSDTRSPFELTAVVPAFNRRTTLARCLDSILNQTRPVEHIIVVDDGSTDGTEEWIRSTYPTVQLISQPNQGVSSARNAGIRAAPTDWIAFLDSDDEWLSNKIERQIAFLQTNSECKTCHTQENWIFRGKQKKVPLAYAKYGGWIFAHCLPVCAISPSTALIHRSVFEEIGYFDEALPACEDYDLWLRIASRYSVALVDEALIMKHGGHSDQLSNQRGLDAYRIKALENILNTAVLKPEYRTLAIETLQSKCAILANGAEKRERTEEAERFRSISQRYQID